jgi:hypothetical protein
VSNGAPMMAMSNFSLASSVYVGCRQLMKGRCANVVIPANAVMNSSSWCPPNMLRRSGEVDCVSSSIQNGLCSVTANPRSEVVSKKRNISQDSERGKLCC